ncbi:Sugar kinase of the NBD/HSP70 family, may contain an N-terminal HTH domain [Poseidonocella pacifica]|uniref:Sugar kinase of the NBD/HSP70 family, may contain an N-terminal HTH domain n=1 Tax=Poseidonocella pacifica TaxID=871651 RepID=A0A1I0WM86_9RHOB|nr:ROK family protein [Poseidonocella pacifica]SFA89103.1 Sugar kinase of the NBD/HSP70 family, may contain an N-terminal HTH domain [Poseidonocella pacifica]
MRGRLRELKLPRDGIGPMVPVQTEDTPALRQKVYDCVRSCGRISRRDVAKRLAISPATVTNLVAELLEQGLLEEVETGTKRDRNRGRPPVALKVRGEAGYVAGVMLSDEVHSGIILDYAGKAIADVAIPRRPGADVSLVDEAERVFLKLAMAAGIGMEQIDSLGLGLPGVVDNANGTILWSPIMQARNVPMAELLSARLGVPVEVDNDANLVTLAELWYGAGRRVESFAVITIENGLGMGLVTGHKLYRGTHSAALELGHTKVQLDGALCRCGQRGCLEAYVADYALVREASVAMQQVRGKPVPAQVQLESLYDQAKAGNEAARTIFRRAGRFLAVGLANVISLFDPELIVLSGARMKFDYLYAEDVLNETRQLAVDAGRNVPDIEINAWGGLVWARGAATLALAAASARRTARPEVVV